jgi:N-acetylneuraminic acid mutarotase
VLVASLSVAVLSALAQAPGILSNQGKLTVSGTNFTGTAAFKFALVNTAGNATFWSDNGTSTGGGIPNDPPISLAVSRGIFAVNLGDPTVPNMTLAVSPNVFTNGGVFLRTWVNDGVDGWQQLSPDRQMVSVGYALMANSVTGPIAGSSVTGTLPAPVMQSSLPSGITVVSMLASDSSLLTNGYQFLMTVPPPAWVTGSTTLAPSARSGHTTLWDGQQLIVWGGNAGSSSPTYVNTGGLYDPIADQWTTITPFDAPDARSGQASVWSGSQMIVWGGVNINSGSAYLNTGGRFQPSPQQWSAVSTNNAPAGRSGHLAVWTGSMMFIWGGQNVNGLLNDGALYDPVADQWTTLNLPNPPEARINATAVWAGDRVIIWGGVGAGGPLNDGGELLFSSGAPSQWVATTLNGAPPARSGHSAVWTGQQMIIWGGNAGAALGDGALFSPSSNTWTVVSTNNSPAARYNHAALWTGAQMLILGGSTGSGELASGSAFNPVTGLWQTLSSSGMLARTQLGAVWSGTQAVVFGGLAGGQPVAALQTLVPQPAFYFYSKL